MNAEFQNDPWQHYAVNGKYGARSWCMWKAGQFASDCNPSANDQPLQELTAFGEDTIDDGGVIFLKGIGGLHLNQCSGVDPLCRDWYESGVGIGGHTFRTFADGASGNYQTVDNWARWEKYSFTKGIYDIYVWVPNTNLNYPDLDGNGDDDTYTWEAKYGIRDCNGNLFENRIVDEYVGSKPTKDGGWVRETNNPYEKWLNIGTYCFDGTSYVYLTDVTGENRLTHCHEDDGNNGWCRLTTDAIRFVRRGYLDYLPLLLQQPTPTPTRTPTLFFTPTPTRTPTPNPAYTVCEPNDLAKDSNGILVIPTNWNPCLVSETARSYFLYHSNGTDDVDVFHFTYTAPSCGATVTLYLEDIPEQGTQYRYRFEVYNSNGTWKQNGLDPLNTGVWSRSYVLESGKSLDYYMRVYSEEGYSSSQTYQVRYYEDRCNLSSPADAYPAP